MTDDRRHPPGTVLVTGGLGVMGSQVVRTLAAAGRRVVALDVSSDTTLLEGASAEITIVEQDVTDVAGLTALFARHRVSVVAHLAARLIAAGEADPFGTFTVNVGGTVNVLEAARRAGTRRVVYASSRSVYGRIEGRNAYPDYLPVTEDHPLDPDDVYGATKVAAELAGRNWERVHGLVFVALRFGHIFGPGRLERHGTVALHDQLVDAAVNGRAVTVPAGGDERDDLVYVRDVAAGVARACLAERLAERTYHIGSGRGTTLKEFAEALRDVVPGAPIRVGPGLDPFGTGKSHYCVFDVSRAERDLGVRPAFGLREALADYVAWLSSARTPAAAAALAADS